MARFQSRDAQAASLRGGHPGPGPEAELSRSLGNQRPVRKLLVQLTSCLDHGGHEDAAGSLREGIEETLTVLKVGLSPSLLTSLSTTLFHIEREGR